MNNQSKIHQNSTSKCSKIEVLGGSGRLLGGSRAAPWWLLLQAREPILVPFKGASRASRGGPWSDLGKLLGALEEPYGDQVGPKGPSEARKKQRLQESRFERLLEPSNSRNSRISEAKTEPSWIEIGTKINLMLKTA